jgi:hypothetical protein
MPLKRVSDCVLVIRVEKTIVNVVAGSSQQYSTYLHHQRWY